MEHGLGRRLYVGTVLFASGVARGLRSLWQRPAYALVSIALLGASTAALLTMAAVLDALLVRPPSGRNPEQLVFVRSAMLRGQLSRPNYLDLRQATRSFASLFAYDSPSSVGLRAGSTEQEVVCQGVSSNFFSTLGVEVAAGRGFEESDDQDEATPVVLLSAGLQQQLKIAIGESIALNEERFTVIGTVPASYESVERDARAQLWVPLSQVTAYRVSWLLWNRAVQWLRVGGRLAPGVSLDAARADVAAIFRQIAADNPTVMVSDRFSLAAFLPTRLAQDARSRTLLLLGGSVVALFALAFTNFFALSLVRLLSRWRDIALRMALGGTARDVAAWLLGEVLGVLLLGVLLGRSISAVLLQLARLDPAVDRLLMWTGAALDLRSMGLVVVCVALGGLVVWLAIVRQLRDADLLGALKGTAATPRRHRSFVVLLAGQMALALCLVALSLGFLDTLRAVIVRPLPFRTDSVWYANVDVRKLGWFNDRERSNAFYSSVLERLRRTPGVLDAGASDALPLAYTREANVYVRDEDPMANLERSYCDFVFTEPGFFRTLGLDLVAGRSFDAAELDQATYASVISRTMARRFWSSEAGAVGQTFRPWELAPPSLIVGVVDDVPASGAADKAEAAQFYLPLTTTTSGALGFVVHADPTLAPSLLGAALRDIWPNASLPQWRPMEDHVRATRSDLVTASRLASWVALLATAEIACALYFFSAFTAAHTSKDAALRIALGARADHIVRQHVSRYAGGVFAGMLLGAAIVLSARPILVRLEVDLRPPALAYVAVAALLLGAIAVAGLCAPQVS